MNLFVDAFHEKAQHAILNNILRKFKIKNCYITYNEFKIEKKYIPSFTKAYFYNVRKINRFGPNITGKTQITPLDGKILKSLVECEIIFLRMMDRYHYKTENLNYNFRKIFYLNHVRYWNHILENKQIDLAIFGNIPHGAYNYIIFHLCKLKNIPTVILFQTHVEDSILFFDNFEEPSFQLKKVYNKLCKELENTSESEIQLSDRFEYHLKRQMDQFQDPTPFYMNNPSANDLKIISFVPKMLFLQLKEFFQILFTKKEIQIKIKENLRRLKKSIEFIINTSIKAKIHRKKKKIKKSKKLFTLYESLTIEPDFSTKYIYVPLHFQPELTTTPLAGVYTDQQLIVQLLSYLVPKNVYLYVKENPKQTYLCRNEDFYKELFLIPNVRLISRSVNTYQLINNSIAVATCTGTAGWEALFREKPVLLFGTIYYQYMKGVFKINSIEDCQNALNQIIKNNVKPTLKDIKIFLKAMDLTTVKVYSDLDYKKLSNIAHKKNINR